jgi:hypothetical protein
VCVNTAGKTPEGVAEEWQPFWGQVVELHWLWAFHRDLWGNPDHEAISPAIFGRRPCSGHGCSTRVNLMLRTTGLL